MALGYVLAVVVHLESLETPPDLMQRAAHGDTALESICRGETVKCSGSRFCM